MKKYVYIVMMVVLMATLLFPGCSNSAPVSGDGTLTADKLTGSWELFEPLGSWAEKMVLQNGGKLTLDGASGEWSLENDVLELKLDDGQLLRFNAVMEGDYYLVLDNRLMDFSLWYINPKLFADGEVDPLFLGTWLNADGSDTITLSAEGKYERTVLSTGEKEESNYFARDGIARFYNEDTGVSYYSYQVASESSMLMLSKYDFAGSTDAYYYPPADRSAYIGEWKQVALTGEEDTLPESITLSEDGTGAIGGGNYEGNITWEAYGDNLLVMYTEAGELVDFYCDVVTGSMYISDELSTEAMLACDAQLVDLYDSITSLEGEWTNYGGITAKITADKKMTLTVQEADRSTVYEGEILIGSDMIKLTTPDTELYLVYQIDLSGESLYMGFVDAFIADGDAYWTMQRVLD